MSRLSNISAFVRKNPALLAAFSAMLVISAFSEDALYGAARGLDLCFLHVVPATFPFLVLADMIGTYSAASGSVLLGGITGNLSGYPAGGRICARLTGSSDYSDAEKILLLTACVGAGPGFLISTVGTGILGSSGAGVLLFASQILTSATAAFILFLKRRGKQKNVSGSSRQGKRPADGGRNGFSFPAVMVESTGSACMSMLYICGFVTFFSSLIGIAEGIAGDVSGIPGMMLAGLLEISNGCGRADLFSGAAGFALLGGLLGFGGLSVFCQLAAVTSGSGITVKQLAVSRAAAFFLGAFYSLILWASFPAAVSVSAFDPLFNPSSFNSLSVAVPLCILFCVLFCADKRTGKLVLFGRGAKN